MFFEKPSHEPNTCRKGAPKGMLVGGTYRGMGAYQVEYSIWKAKHFQPKMWKTFWLKMFCFSNTVFDLISAPTNIPLGAPFLHVFGSWEGFSKKRNRLSLFFLLSIRWCCFPFWPCYRKWFNWAKREINLEELHFLLVENRRGHD